MPDQITDELPSWDKIADQEQWSALLLGNGFSQNIWRRFGYQSLFKKASEGEGAKLVEDDKKLFASFDTTNFEFVLSALTTSKIVGRALEQDIRVLTERETSIRDALIAAVHAVHIPWASVEKDTLSAVAAEMATFESVYCTNYDLLIYWSLMQEPGLFKDFFFGSQTFDIDNTEVWGNKTKIHFLHGGLHLYRKPSGATVKRKAEDGKNLLDLFGTDFADAVPLFVSEGIAADKLISIQRSDYLTFLFSRFKQDDGPVVVFGHSLSKNDRHITNVLASRANQPIAVSMRKEEDIEKNKAALFKVFPRRKIFFYDAATHPLGKPTLTVAEPKITELVEA